MRTPHTEKHHETASYKSYVIGFVLSVVLTFVAYFIATNTGLSGRAVMLSVLGVAIVQLIVQLVFFLHVSRGSHWKLLTLIFTIFFVLLIVVGTIWVMDHLNYNMMQMSPDEMNTYMKQNEGI